MDFRRYKPEFKEACLKILEELHNDNRPKNLFLKSEIALVLDDSTVVGLAGFERGELHNSIVVEYLCVSKRYRRQGLGTKLHKNLVEHYPIENSSEVIDISCYSNQKEAQGFIKSLGFSKYLDCYLNTFDPSNISNVEPKYQISSLKDFYQNDDRLQDIKRFYIQRYRQEHDGHLPVTGQEEVWDDYFSDGDVNLGVVLHKEDVIYAVSFAYLNFGEEVGIHDKEVIAFNGYALGEDSADEAENLISLYSYQCDLVKDKDVLIYIEVDSSERVSSYLQDWFPKCEKVFERYQLKIL